MKRTVDRQNEIDRLSSARVMAIVAFMASSVTLAFMLYRTASLS